MSRTIFLRVGERDRVPLNAFIDSLRNFLRVLQDLDATISRDPRGSVIWDVVSLQKGSPPVVGVAPTRRRGLQDCSEAVEEQFLTNARLLDAQGERTRYFSDSALVDFERIAKRTKRLGTIAVYTNGSGAAITEGVITERTLRNVRELTGVKYSAYGSVIGNLDSISVHRGNEFRVWDETTKKPVLSKFRKGELERVKSFLGVRVTVSGILNSNSAGMPVCIAVDEIDPVEQRDLPSIEEMSGLVENFTEGKSLKQYLEDLADE